MFLAYNDSEAGRKKHFRIAASAGPFEHKRQRTPDLAVEASLPVGVYFEGGVEVDQVVAEQDCVTYDMLCVHLDAVPGDLPVEFDLDDRTGEVV